LKSSGYTEEEIDKYIPKTIAEKVSLRKTEIEERKNDFEQLKMDVEILKNEVKSMKMALGKKNDELVKEILPEEKNKVIQKD